METEVDDVNDVGYGDRALGDVGRQDDFAVVLLLLGQLVKDA